MNLSSKRLSALRAISGTLLVVLCGCGSGWDSYDPPPEATLVQPEGGAFAVGDSLEVTFSEAVDPDTVRVRVWGDVRNIENEIPDDEEPIVATCSLASSPCGDLDLQLEDGNRKLVLTFDEAGLGEAGPPMILEIARGLADVNGRKVGVMRLFDFQFRAEDWMNQDPVVVDNGKYILISSVDKPLPYVIMLVCDLTVLENGDMVLAGLDGNPVEGAAKNTDDPTKIVINTNDTGWSVFLRGFVRLEDGQRLLETEPIDITVPAGPITVSLQNVKIFAEITKDEATGFDRFDGTLSHTKLVISTPTRSTEYDPGSTALAMTHVSDDVVPEGHPELCGDLCGDIVGLCTPPDDFPPAEFCAEN